MFCTSKKLTKIADMDSFDFSLIMGFIVALILIPLVLFNIEKIEKTFSIPEYREVNEVCMTPTCLFPVKLDKPELRETRPGTILLFFLVGVLFFSLVGYFVHCLIIDKVYYS